MLQRARVVAGMIHDVETPISAGILPFEGLDIVHGADVVAASTFFLLFEANLNRTFAAATIHAQLRAFR